MALIAALSAGACSEPATSTPARAANDPATEATPESPATTGAEVNEAPAPPEQPAAEEPADSPEEGHDAPPDETPPGEDVAQSSNASGEDAPAQDESPVPVAEAQPALPPQPQRACASVPWGGYTGTAQCRGFARRQVRGAHRRCETNEDCVMVGAVCEEHGVNRRFAARYRRWAEPCDDPSAGQCMDTFATTCSMGCCQ